MNFVPWRPHLCFLIVAFCLLGTQNYERLLGFWGHAVTQGCEFDPRWCNRHFSLIESFRAMVL
jgi:hypothetical protein